MTGPGRGTVVGTVDAGGGTVVAGGVGVAGTASNLTRTEMSAEAVTLHVEPVHPSTLHVPMVHPAEGTAVNVMVVPSSTLVVDEPADARDSAPTDTVTVPSPTWVNETCRDVARAAVTLAAAVVAGFTACAVQ